MKNSILKRFGNNVKRLRKSKGWSQEILARQSGLHRTYIGSIENGGRNVSLINIERIAKALHANIEVLIKWEK
ncbi:MAG: helix-turn-helix transcriptional regulator [Candidatus Omnitrophica bacterium]|nr:helix-turn-helix transcriptional regulator [Candidatus Omnitrophota bacterium]